MKIPNLSIQQLLEAGVHLRSQDFKMESKNEKIYFWKKRLSTYYRFTQTLELTTKLLKKYMKQFLITEKYY